MLYKNGRKIGLDFYESSGLTEILTSLTLDEPADVSEYQHIILVDESEINITRHLKNQLIDISSLILWYQESTELSIDTVMKFVEKQFHSSNHPSNRNIAEIFLALFALTHKNSGKSAIQHLKDQFELILPTKTTIFYILPVESIPNLPKCTFGPYTYGELNFRELRKLDRVAKSDFVKEYQQVIKGKMAISRRMPDFGVINWLPFLDSISINIYMVRYAVISGWAVDTYYDHVNKFLFDIFFEEMLTHQALLISLGSMHIDPERYLTPIDVTTVVAYGFNTTRKQRQKGLISARGHFYRPNIDPAIFDIPSHNALLRENYDFIDYADTPLHHTLKAFTKFVARAKVLTDKNKPSEAFLQYVIALELVFGGTEAISSTIAKRATVVTHIQLDQAYERLRQRIRDDYRLRSTYVHEGQPIDLQRLNSIAEVCQCILHSMLYLQREFPQMQIDTWMENIDTLAYQLESGKQPSNELLRLCGAVHPMNRSSDGQ